LSEEHFFLGIDMSTTGQAKQGKTVAALFREDFGKLALVTIFPVHTDEELLSLLQEQPFALCGMDAPLRLPPYILRTEDEQGYPLGRWLDYLGEHQDALYHYRLSDILIRKTLRNVGPKPALSRGGPVDLTPLTLRWLRLSRRLKGKPELQQRIIEVYASGAVQLFASALGLVHDAVFRYRKRNENRTQLLLKMIEKELIVIPDPLWGDICEHEDYFDAVIAGLTTWHAFYHRALSPTTFLGLGDTSLHIKEPTSIPVEERHQMVEFLSDGNWAYLPDTSFLIEENSP